MIPRHWHISEHYSPPLLACFAGLLLYALAAALFVLGPVIFLAERW